MGLLRCPHALCRRPIDQSGRRRLRTRPSPRVYHGDAATPLRLQHLCRPSQPGADAGEAADRSWRTRKRTARSRSLSKIPDDFDELPEDEQQEIIASLGGRRGLGRPRGAPGGDSPTQQNSSTRPACSNSARSRSKLSQAQAGHHRPGMFADPEMKLLLFTEHKDTLDYLDAASCGNGG